MWNAVADEGLVGGEKEKWLLLSMNLLLKDSTKLAIGGISGEGDRGQIGAVWVRMEEKSGRAQNFLDVVKSSQHGQ